MPYTIKKYNGQTLSIIQDGTVDTLATDLQLPGRNYAGYGSALNQSLVYLLENFANSTEPSHKITGQLWFDTSVKKIKVFNGIDFRPLGSIEHSDTAPTGQLIGDMWFNTTTNQLFVYGGSDYKLIGPLLTNPNAAQLVSKKLIETGGNTRTVLETVVNNEVVAIFSNQEFTIKDDQTPVTGFSQIFKGINLPSRSIVPNNRLNGVARTSESLLIGSTEVQASNFLQNTGSNQTMTTSLRIRVEPDVNAQGLITNSRGLFVGGSDNFYFGYNQGTGYVSNLTGSLITFGVTTSGRLVRVVNVDTGAQYPEVDSTIDLGTETKRWKNVYANKYYAVDSPNLAPNNAGFFGRIVGTSVSASLGFTGNLTGNVRGNIQRIDGTNVLTVSGDTPAFNGRTNGQHFGNVINLNAPSENQAAVDVSGSTTIFRGSFSGISTTTSTLRVGTTNYSGYVGTSLSQEVDFRDTVAIRDAQGNLRAQSFIGNAVSATAILDQNGVARLGSIGGVPFTVVIRDSTGAINVGNITGTTSNALKLSDLSMSVQNLPNTIVARDGAGDIFVGTVHGTATSARYADLAEKYLADNEYEVGTVMMIGGEKEVTACTWGKRAIGAVSANPAYLMNKDLDGGTVVALKGRIPVKVIGAIKKGDELIASDNGCAVMAVPHASRVFAVALESNDDTGVKLVECLIL